MSGATSMPLCAKPASYSKPATSCPSCNETAPMVLPHSLTSASVFTTSHPSAMACLWPLRLSPEARCLALPSVSTNPSGWAGPVSGRPGRTRHPAPAAPEPGWSTATFARPRCAPRCAWRCPPARPPPPGSAPSKPPPAMRAPSSASTASSVSKSVIFMVATGYEQTVGSLLYRNQLRYIDHSFHFVKS